jgi:hypothetical protein
VHPVFGLAGQTANPTQFSGPGVPPPLPHPVVPMNYMHTQHPHPTDTGYVALGFRVGRAKPRPARSGVPPPPSLHHAHPVVPINDPHHLHPHPTDTECVALGFLFGRAKTRPTRSTILDVLPLPQPLSHHLMDSVNDP